MQHIIAAQQLVRIFDVIDCEAFDRRIEKVNPESHVWIWIVQVAKHRWHDVDLFSQPIINAFHTSVAFKKHDRDGKVIYRCVIFLNIRIDRMIGSDDKQGIFKPGHLSGRVKKLLKRVVGITDALVNRDSAFRKLSLVFLRKFIRMMRRNRKESCIERFLHRIHFLCKILKERFVPDAPYSVEIGFISIFVTTKILLEPGDFSEGIKTHRSIGSAMKKGRLISLD